MQEEFIIIFSWGVSQNSFCNSNKLLYFFILDRFKMQREMTTCQINFSCGIFPIRVTQRKVRRLICYGQCIYRYCTGGWLQQADDKLSIEKKPKQNNQITKKKKKNNSTTKTTPHQKNCFTSSTFCILPVNSPFFLPSSQNALFFLSISLQQTLVFSYFPAYFRLPQQWKLSEVD